MDNFAKYQQAILDSELKREQRLNGLTEATTTNHTKKDDGGYSHTTISSHRDLPDGRREHIHVIHTRRQTTPTGKFAMNGKENRSDVHHFMTDAEGNKRTLVDTRGDNKKLAKPYALGDALKDEQIHNQDHLTKHLNAVKSEHDTNGHWHDSESGQHDRNWFSKMSKEAQEEYKRKHPHAKVDHVDTSGMFSSEKMVHYNKDRVGKTAHDDNKQEIADSKVIASHPAQNANNSGHVEVAYKKPNGDVHLVKHYHAGGANDTRVISADAMQHLKSM